MLTKQGVFAILYKLSARDTHRAALKDGANLENDTEKRENQTSKRDDLLWQGARRGERKTVRFEELNAGESRESGGFGEPRQELEELEKD